MITPFEATRVDAMSAAKDLIDSGKLGNQLSQLVMLRTESQNPRQAWVLDQYLRLIIRPILLEMGFNASVHDNPIPNAPLKLANRLETSDLSAMSIYGHGDVIHSQDAQWDEGLSPFEAVIRNSMMFGRGIADNKGQHLINLMALKTLIDLWGLT